MKDFKEEIDLIYDNNQVREKLLTLKVYNVFYNDILEALSVGNNNVIEYYESIIKDTFKMTVKILSVRDDMNFNAKQFMQIYVWLFRFKCIDTQNIDDIYGIICSFNNSFVDGSPLFDDKIIKVLDKYESIPFDIKVNIMLQFYEFSRNVHFGLKSMFNEEVSSKLDSNISNMLLIRLGDYLNDALNKGINLNESTDSLKTFMMMTTKDYLMNKLNNGEFGIDSYRHDTINKPFSNKPFSSFNEFEQKLWLVSGIYAIAGYDGNDLPKETLEKLIKEVKNISPKDYINFFQNLTEKIENEFMFTQDDDGSPKKYKK